MLASVSWAAQGRRRAWQLRGRSSRRRSTRPNAFPGVRGTTGEEVYWTSAACLDCGCTYAEQQAAQTGRSLEGCFSGVREFVIYGIRYGMNPRIYLLKIKSGCCVLCVPRKGSRITPLQELLVHTATAGLPFVPQFPPERSCWHVSWVLRRALCPTRARRSLARVGWSAWSPFRPLG